ncbi:Nucleotide-binding, alpha-beta plait domain containing protein [Dorcoceras hygrometricum]|uniref:Nucleotide-binding, alpha-beta plait domain containing protein n=1 Tax=Dorcoceras hygrometricum TaxID=472368 RepID=A0A2Z6ZW96_9LAMI|nr:Nucleotide-binding, alpha-beta plait domain containing protein [Dorcoceras hygrometricum]
MAAADVCWPHANGSAVVGRSARLCLAIGAAMPHMMWPACGRLPHATLAAAARYVGGGRTLRWRRPPPFGDVSGSVATADFF